MKFALVHETRICQFAADKAGCFPVAPELKWVEVADDATTADAYSDGAVVTFIAPVVPQSAVLDGIAFLARFAPEEYQMITAAGRSNAQLGMWIEMLRMRGSIDVTGKTALEAKAGVVAMKLLTQDRAEIIFAPPRA